MTIDIWLLVSRLATLLFTGLIAWITYRSYLLLKHFQPDFNLLLSPPETLGRLVMAGICLGLAWLSGLSAADLGLAVDNLWSTIQLGIGLGLATQVAVYLITTWLIKIFGRHIYSPWLIRNILPDRPLEWLLVTLAFIPPVAMEELLFRTLLIGLFKPVLPITLLIIVTSIVFGLMHQPQGRLGMALAGIINALFCLVFVWTGQLLVTFLAHYCVNILQVVVAHFHRDWLESY